MSRNLKLCAPCGQKMLATPMGTSERSFLARLVPKLCTTCRPAAQIMLEVLRIREGVRNIDKVSAYPDISNLTPDSSGWANVKRKR